MTSVADTVADLVLIKHDVDSEARKAYESIRAWCMHQRTWKVRLWNSLRPWHTPTHPAIPMRPLYWRVLVMIKPPETVTKGGIIKASITTDAEQFLTYVGMVVAHGRLAFKSKTRANVKLQHEKNPRLGDDVVFFKNAGTRFATIDGFQFVMLSDTELWSVTEDPAKLDTTVI
jgi:co-chaperonin GroES (HSP10)